MASALGILVLSGLVFGQQSSQERGERLQELQQRLNLSPEQIERIRPILEDEAKKAREIRAKYDGDSRRSRIKLLRELRSLREDAQKRIEPILTPDQQAEWKKIRAERREEMRARRRQ